MATFTITIPADKVATLLEAFAQRGSYQETILVDGVPTPNPVSKADFAKAQVLNFIREVYKDYKIAVELATVNASAQSTAKAEINTLTIA